jgi:enamine deaminase RidA (YjgF/YER057c/UK114 family)
MFRMRSALSTLSRRTSNANIVHLQQRCVHVEANLEKLSIELPPAPKPAANYNIVCRTTGNIMYVSGHIPFTNDGTLLTGAVGSETCPGPVKSVEDGQAAARACGLNMLATLKRELGDLDRIEQVVKVRNLRARNVRINIFVVHLILFFRHSLLL